MLYLLPLCVNISTNSIDSLLNNTPLEPTEIEKANTLLAGADSMRYQVPIFNFGLQPNNLTYNDVKTQLLYLNQLNRSNSTSHPVMSTVTSSINKLSVDTPAQATTPTPVQNYNPTFLPYNMANVPCVAK